MKAKERVEVQPQFRCPVCQKWVPLAYRPKPGAVYNRKCECGEHFLISVPREEIEP